MINKPMLNKQTTGFRFIPFLRILRNIPVSIPECPNSAGMIRHRNDENSRPSCQSSFLWNPPDSAGMTGFLQELGGHCKDLRMVGLQRALCDGSIEYQSEYTLYNSSILFSTSDFYELTCRCSCCGWSRC